MDTTSEDECRWHACCFTLAELARRGCLLPIRLPHIVRLVCKALVFDVRRGRHSVGSAVRDSAAYVCWALARAFSPTDLQLHVQSIADTLMLVAITDREVSVRRAAASAFQVGSVHVRPVTSQELVGRHRGVEHSTAIMEHIDYATVSNVTRCYSEHVIFLTELTGTRYCMCVVGCSLNA
jgi:hypothetical protein